MVVIAPNFDKYPTFALVGMQLSISVAMATSGTAGAHKPPNSLQISLHFLRNILQ